MSKKVFNNITTFNIIDNGANLSDHNPIAINIILTCQAPPDNFSPTTFSPKPMPSMRWDKADLTKYYLNSSFNLQTITTPSHLLSCNNCSNAYHHSLIDQFCSAISNALSSADQNSVPRINPKRLKVSGIQN